MAGIFDIKTGAFDSSEAALLHQAYEIAIQGLKATHEVDRPLGHRLARSIVKVARNEPDCLRNDGTIDPVRLAQRAILRMLQTTAPSVDTPSLDMPSRERTIELERPRKPSFRERFTRRAVQAPANPEVIVPRAAESPSKIMMRLFERTPFAKL